MVNKEISVIRDIITPLDHYPHLNENQTLLEAIQTLKSFRREEQGNLYAAVLLVLNDKNNLVGKLSLVEIMHGLIPRLVDVSIGGKFEGKEENFPNLAFLYEESTFAACRKNQQKPIKSLLKPIEFSLPVDTNILKALVMMSHQNDFNVPVTDEEGIVGMLCLEKIFNSICTTYCDIAV